MKCHYCGEEVNLYKEIKEIMKEMGVTKEVIQLQMNQVLESVVKNAVNEKIDKAIQEAVKKLINDNGYTVRSAIEKEAAKFIGDKLIVSLKKEEEKKCLID